MLFGEKVLISKKEAKEQLSELKRMLLPEMVPDKLNNLNVEEPEGYDDLFRVHDSLTPGTGLIRLLIERIIKVKSFGGDVIDSETGKLSELGHLNENITIVCQQLEAFTSNTEMNVQSRLLLEEIITSSILIGYTSGSHDMRVNTERHGSKGYKSSVVTPKKGGDQKSKQSDKAKELVNMMAENIRNNSQLAGVDNKTLSTAISTVFYKFKERGRNKHLAALKNFKNNFPEERTVQLWLKKDHVKSERNSNMRKPNINKIEFELTKSFPNKKIMKILTS